MGDLVCSEEGSLSLSCRNSWEESVSLSFLDDCNRLGIGDLSHAIRQWLGQQFMYSMTISYF